MFLISMKKYSKDSGYFLLIVIIKMWHIQKIYYLRCCLLSSSLSHSLTTNYAHWHIGSMLFPYHNDFFTGQGCWPCAKPPTWKARGLLFV